MSAPAVPKSVQRRVFEALFSRAAIIAICAADLAFGYRAQGREGLAIFWCANVLLWSFNAVWEAFHPPTEKRL